MIRHRLLSSKTMNGVAKTMMPSTTIRYSQLAVLISFICAVDAFSTAIRMRQRQLLSSTTTNTLNNNRDNSNNHQLYNIIRPESVDFDFDVGQGGVRLAEESIIKIFGTVVHKPGNAEPKISNLLRYQRLHTIAKEQFVVNTMQQIGATIIAAGRGTELYKDPGSSTEQVILFSPIEAVKDALIGAKSAMQCTNLVINFCSGDDAQVLDVLSATRKMVLDLDIATKTKISFNSISHSTFPISTSAVTVVSIPESVDDTNSSTLTTEEEQVVKAISSGEIYFRDGIFYTLLEEDVNPAIA